MIVAEFNIMGIAILPNEADAPLVIDADAVLAGPVVFLGFQAVGWWYPKVFQLGCLIDHRQFALCSRYQICRSSFRRLPQEHRGCALIGEGLDHRRNVGRYGRNVNRYEM